MSTTDQIRRRIHPPTSLGEDPVLIMPGEAKALCDIADAARDLTNSDEGSSEERDAETRMMRGLGRLDAETSR